MTPRSIPARSCGWVCVLLVALASGCSGRGTVSGTVKYKGELLTTGEVNFIAAGGASRSGLIGSDGRYEITDAPPGEVVVVVTATRAEGGKASGSPLTASKADKAPVVRSLVPVKYGDPKTSDLRYTVAAGSQVKDFELTD